MRRHCDGTDPNLIRHEPRACPSCSSTLIRQRNLVGCGLPCDSEWHDKPVYTPCDCGARFDDVDFTVIYPHIQV